PALMPRPPSAPLFPYTTLFRSRWPRAPACSCTSPPRWRGESRTGNAAVDEVPERSRTERIGSLAVSIQVHDGSLEEVIAQGRREDRKSTRLNSSHVKISYAVFC